MLVGLWQSEKPLNRMRLGCAQGMSCRYAVRIGYTSIYILTLFTCHCFGLRKSESIPIRHSCQNGAENVQT